MAITIFEMGYSGSSDPSARPAPFLAKQTGVVGGASVQSDTLRSQTDLITIHSDEACRVLIEENPTATVTDFPIGAGATADFKIVKSGVKVAWIAQA